MLTIEFRLKEKLLSGDKIFEYTLRLAVFATTQYYLFVKLPSIQQK